MIVLDSSAWIEFFANGPHADEVAARLRSPASVLTPSIALYEVYKWVKRERSEEEALEAVAAMKKTRVVDLDESIALMAADLSLAHGIAMTDSMMLAVARASNAELLTTDSDFRGIEGATVLPRTKSS